MNSQAEPKDGKVNREKTCPLLLRVFCGSLKHNSLSDYSRGKAPGNELQIYTWLDATLRELSNLVKQVNPEVKRKGTIFDFAVVTPDSRAPVYRLKNIGSVCAGVPSDADRIMLKDCQFCIGDMIDVAITPPQASSQFHIRSSTLNARGGVIRRQIRTFAERPAQSSGPWAEESVPSERRVITVSNRTIANLDANSGVRDRLGPRMAQTSTSRSVKRRRLPVPY